MLIVFLSSALVWVKKISWNGIVWQDVFRMSFIYFRKFETTHTAAKYSAKIRGMYVFALEIEYSWHNFVYEMSTLCQDSDLIANYVLVHHDMHTLVILFKYGDYIKLWIGTIWVSFGFFFSSFYFTIIYIQLVHFVTYSTVIFQPILSLFNTVEGGMWWLDTSPESRGWV